jgi:hypothetical protein
MMRAKKRPEGKEKESGKRKGEVERKKAMGASATMSGQRVSAGTTVLLSGRPSLAWPRHPSLSRSRMLVGHTLALPAAAAAPLPPP